MLWNWSRYTANVLIIGGTFLFFLTPHRGIAMILAALGSICIILNSWQHEHSLAEKEQQVKGVLFPAPGMGGPRRPVISDPTDDDLSQF